MGEMRDSDWSRENLLRSDWSGPIVATITTSLPVYFESVKIENMFFDKKKKRKKERKKKRKIKFPN